MKKIKITFVLNNFLLGGAERLLLEIIKEMDKKMFEVSVVTIMGGGILETEFKKLNIPIFFAGPIHYPSSLFTKMLWLVGLPFFVVRLAFFLKKNKTDIIVNSMYKADIMTYLALIKPKLKIVSIQHDLVRFHPVIKSLKIRALKKTDKVIAISNSVKDFLIRYFEVEAAKIEVIYNGIDIARFSSFQKSNQEWRPVLGTIARLDKIKGHRYLLQALLKIREDGLILPKVILVGDGPERENLILYLKKNNLKNVVMVGEKIAIGDYLKEMDVFILPSLSEGLGLSIIEALAAGKLILTTKVGGLRELIQHQETGLLVEPGDANDLYQKIKWIIENKEKALEIKERSGRWIRDRQDIFEIKNVSQKYARLFRKLSEDLNGD